MASAQRTGRCALLPLAGESAALSSWDFVTTAALLYTATITPFELGFLQAPDYVDAWFIINRVLDTIFIIDMALQVTTMPHAHTAACTHPYVHVSERA